MIAITSINELKAHCDDSPYNEFCLRLNAWCRSTKRIQYWPEYDSWCIFNDIDDSMAEYDSTDDFIKNESLIYKAINSNAFFKD
jgi:hypothetical protein